MIDSEPDASKAGASLGSATVYALFFASGAAALVYQVLWSRWLGLTLGNTTASVAIVLAAFMCGLALGSGWIGPRTARVADPMRWYALIEWTIGLIAAVFPWRASHGRRAGSGGAGGF